MQYPQIQFYRGSLVRLASGKLKQVEDLSSEDFLESGRLITQSQPSTCNTETNQQLIDQNNNHKHSNSVFNSPEQTSSFDSPTMELMDTEMDYELDAPRRYSQQQNDEDQDQEEDDEDEELDVVSDIPPVVRINRHQQHHKQLKQQQHQQQQPQDKDSDNLYIDSSVVKDFLEVGPPSTAHSPESLNPSPPNCWKPEPSTSSASPRQVSTIFHQQTATPSPNATVLIKFFLESSRSVVFIEVPTEHPFFVFHRGWSSWNPQRTYDKFGLKCRKLKIGDTCISLIRRQQQRTMQVHQLQQQESDQCNILFSSIKIN